MKGSLFYARHNLPHDGLSGKLIHPEQTLQFHKLPDRYFR